MNDTSPAPIFEFFNEIGIISQLSSTLFSRTLPGGLHVAHFSILNHMVRLGDGRTPVQLASAFQLTKATMTHSLGVLERADFVRLQPNPDDGRSKLVHITPEGRAFREQAIQSVGPAFQLILEKLDPELLKSLIPHLRRVRQALDEARSGPPV